MALFSISNVKIKGIAAAVPEKVVSNWDYDRLNNAEKKMLVKTVGVEEKHVASDTQTTSDLCLAAAEKLLLDLNWS